MRAQMLRLTGARARWRAQEKNVSADLLDGKVGRIYMPKQDVGGMALHKMKARRPAPPAWLRHRYECYHGLCGVAQQCQGTAPARALQATAFQVAGVVGMFTV
jgi:hypothetical protein